MTLKYVSTPLASTEVIPSVRIGISYYFTTVTNYVKTSEMLLTSLDIPLKIPDNAVVNSIYIRCGCMVIRLQNAQTSMRPPMLQDILTSIVITLRCLRNFRPKLITPRSSVW